MAAGRDFCSGGESLKKAIAALLCLWSLAGVAREPFAYRSAIPSPDADKALLTDLARAGERLVAVGEAGHIIYSDDAGDTWQHAEVPVSLMLTEADFSSAEQGWAVGHEGIVLYSGDGAETWTVVLQGEDIAALQIEAAERLVAEAEAAVDAAPEEELEDAEWALEDATFALEDARRAQEEGITHPALNVRFADVDTGYVTGAYGMLLHTDDGGATWQLHSNRLDNPSGFHLYDIIRTTGGALIIVGEAGQLHRSVDDGETWEALDSPYEGSFFGALATDSGSLLIFGLRGRIFRSVDDGDSWEYIDAPGESTLFGGRAFDGGRIVLVGAGGTVLESRDDGRSFTKPALETRASLAAVEADADGTLFFAGFGGVLIGLAGSGDSNE